MSVAATRDLAATSNASAEETPKRILVVDDKPDTFEGLKEALAPSGTAWQMEYAGDGDAALAALEREPVDVVITEDQMASMDGVTLLTRVRDQQEAVTAALLHDIGKLVLIADGSRRWAQLTERAFDGVAAVHIANGLANEIAPVVEDEPTRAGLDVELLGRLGLRPRLELWRGRACQLADLVGESAATVR